MERRVQREQRIDALLARQPLRVGQTHVHFGVLGALAQLVHLGEHRRKMLCGVGDQRTQLPGKDAVAVGRGQRSLCGQSVLADRRPGRVQQTIEHAGAQDGERDAKAAVGGAAMLGEHRRRDEAEQEARTMLDQLQCALGQQRALAQTGQLGAETAQTHRLVHQALQSLALAGVLLRLPHGAHLVLAQLLLQGHGATSGRLQALLLLLDVALRGLQLVLATEQAHVALVDLGAQVALGVLRLGLQLGGELTQRLQVVDGALQLLDALLQGEVLLLRLGEQLLGLGAQVQLLLERGDLLLQVERVRLALVQLLLQLARLGQLLLQAAQRLLQLTPLRQREVAQLDQRLAQMIPLRPQRAGVLVARRSRRTFARPCLLHALLGRLEHGLCLLQLGAHLLQLLLQVLALSLGQFLIERDCLDAALGLLELVAHSDQLCLGLGTLAPQPLLGLAHRTLGLRLRLLHLLEEDGALLGLAAQLYVRLLQALLGLLLPALQSGEILLELRKGASHHLELLLGGGGFQCVVARRRTRRSRSR
mmetsp:Transcript_11868/g.36122  ORF Transcript_11868/g.36122 Transcript_11868/m.36122 type:complete len:534 (+) Transcript_11868:479-2080(+)